LYVPVMDAKYWFKVLKGSAKKPEKSEQVVQPHQTRGGRSVPDYYAR
jgi:hypothetical protein